MPNLGQVATLAVLGVAALGCSAAAAVEPTDVRQWHVENSTTVNGNEPYELHNLRRRTLNLTSQLGFVRWRRSWATDMDDVAWTGSSGGQFVFKRTNPRDHRPIESIEVVALYNTKIKAYLTGYWRRDRRHNSHTVAMWSSSPSYVWRVHDRVGPDFALYHIDQRRSLILGGRENGVDATLCFPKSRRVICD